jgi:hypothetical protein
MKGKGRPVVGNNPVTTPIFKRTWSEIKVVNPDARKNP